MALIQVKNEEKPKSSLGRILAPVGTVLGAAAGSVVPAVGTAAGAALGGALGGTAGAIADSDAAAGLGSVAGGVAGASGAMERALNAPTTASDPIQMNPKLQDPMYRRYALMQDGWTDSLRR